MGSKEVAFSFPPSSHENREAQSLLQDYLAEQQYEERRERLRQRPVSDWCCLSRTEDNHADVLRPLDLISVGEQSVERIPMYSEWLFIS